MRFDEVKNKWRGMKASTGFHNSVLFMSFVAVATVFWLILSLNDSVTETFDVNIKLDNVPDSVTFIQDLPVSIHVTVKDKGSNLVRTGMFNRPHVNFNFRDYAENGIFSVNKQEFSMALKTTFGNSAQIASTSVDSLYSRYTTGKGKRVPVDVCSDVSAAPGYIIAKSPVPEVKAVLIYAQANATDTISKVYTECIVRRNLNKTQDVEVKLKPIANVKIVPSSIKVSIPVEPLVKKESTVTVEVEGGTLVEDLLLFPAKVKVEYYTPMSLYSSDLCPVEVWVDYNDIHRTKSDKLPVKTKILADYVESVRVLLDSVEYTVVKK